MRLYFFQSSSSLVPVESRKDMSFKHLNLPNLTLTFIYWQRVYICQILSLITRTHLVVFRALAIGTYCRSSVLVWTALWSNRCYKTYWPRWYKLTVIEQVFAVYCQHVRNRWSNYFERKSFIRKKHLRWKRLTDVSIHIWWPCCLLIILNCSIWVELVHCMHNQYFKLSAIFVF